MRADCDITVSHQLLARGHTSTLGDAAIRLSLAGDKLLLRDGESVELYADIAREYDLRDAWLGLACAYHLRGEVTSAAEIIGRALRYHALDRNAVALVQLIARSVDAPGWCALDDMGNLVVRLSRAPPPGVRPKATLDGRALALRRGSSSLSFVALLPEAWDQAARVEVRLGGSEFLGSPIAIDAIVHVEGFVDCTNGSLHGWAWCPHAPLRDPILSIGPSGGGIRITTVANDRAVAFQHERPLANPRGFRIPSEQLRRFDGPIHVRGAGGENLMGSPLDPSAERRSAERATRMIADLFPPPGHRKRATPGEPSLLPVPAHVIGGPVEGGFKRRPVDVVIPVYGGLELTLACLDSVLVDLPRWARVVVVNDASPDPGVARELGRLAARNRITLLNEVVNRGFPATANIGMRQNATHDVVLLNSDTLLPPGWLTSLREAAYSASDIGSATPLSNDATILSYPSTEHANAMPDLRETIHLDALSQRANAGCLVDIPTAVAFCTYIKRDCINAAGLLREDLFAQGYGGKAISAFVPAIWDGAMWRCQAFSSRTWVAIHLDPERAPPGGPESA